jgi:Uma2 family endonuclease
MCEHVLAGLRISRKCSVMSAFATPRLLSVEEYLDAEKFSNAKHEYVGGQVYAMAGTSRSHNRAALNLQAQLGTHLRGGPCEVYVADVKVRIVIRQQDIFYYPDLVVTCDERDTDEYFLRFPKLVVEVLSDSTERLDRGEKLLSYITIPTLEEYVLVSQHQPLVTIFRRRTNWEPEHTFGLDAMLHLESVNFMLPLRVLYENVRGIA